MQRFVQLLLSAGLLVWTTSIFLHDIAIAQGSTIDDVLGDFDPCLNPQTASLPKNKKRCEEQQKAIDEANARVAEEARRRREKREKQQEPSGICDGVALRDAEAKPLFYPSKIKGEPGKRASDSQGGEINISVITDHEEKQLMKKLRESPEHRAMGAKNVQGKLCPQRAQFAACTLEEKCNLKSAKVFIEPDGWLADTFDVKSDSQPGSYYSWTFHVANLFYKKEGSELKLYVLDLFSDQDKLIPYETWLAEMKKGRIVGEPQKLNVSFEANSTYHRHKDSENRVGKKCSTADADRDLAAAFQENREHEKIRREERALAPQ